MVFPIPLTPIKMVGENVFAPHLALSSPQIESQYAGFPHSSSNLLLQNPKDVKKILEQILDHGPIFISWAR